MRQVLVRLAAPAASPVTLAEVKDHLAIDPAETIHDAVLAGLIEVATAHFDAAEGLLGRCLITQHWRLVLDRFPADIALPLPPLQRIEAVRYAALDGTVRTCCRATTAPSASPTAGRGCARSRPTPGREPR